MEYTTYTKKPYTVQAYLNDDGESYTVSYFDGQSNKTDTIKKAIFEDMWEPYTDAQQQADELKKTVETLVNQALATALVTGNITSLKEQYEKVIDGISDDVALLADSVFSVWSGDGVAYKAGDRVTYNDVLYKVLQSHTSQAAWTPTDAPSLFAKVLARDTGGDTPPAWQQPDSTNPYMKGDRVTFEGKIYESLIDNNVWSPVAYPAGWLEID